MCGRNQESEMKEEISMSKIRRSATIMMICTLFSKILGFARSMVLSHFFGTGAIADAFVIAWQIPTVLFGGIGTALTTCYMPMYNAMRKIGRKEANRFNSNLINITFLLCIFMVIVFFFLAKPIVKITAWDFSGEQLELTVYMAKIMVLSVVFLALTNILMGYVQAHENFLSTGLMSIPQNICIILGIVLGAKYHLSFLALGVMLGYLIQTPYFAVPAIRAGFRYRPYINFKDPAIGQILTLIGPVFLGRMVFDINRMVDKSLATTAGKGSASALQFAYTLNNFVTATFIISITTVIFPQVVKLIGDGSIKEAKKTVLSGMNSISILVLPMMVMLMVLSTPIVSLVYKSGKFTQDSVIMTAPVLLFYSIGLAPVGYRLLMEKVFYALQDTRTPMINAIIAIACNIVLNFTLIIPMKTSGVAFATSISSTVACFLFFFSLKKKIGSFGGRQFLQTLGKVSLACFAMGFVAWSLMRWPLAALLVGGKKEIFFALAIEGLASLGVYFLMMKILRVQEFNQVLALITRRRR